MRHLLPASIAVVATLCANVASAQIVDVLGKIDEEDEGFNLNIATSIGFKTGNTTLVQAKLQSKASYVMEDHVVFLTGEARFGTKEQIDKLTLESFDDDDLVHISRLFEHLRYRYTFFEWLQLEVFQQIAADKFTDLAIRFLIGAGPRVYWEPMKDLTIAAGLAYMLEYEQYSKSLLQDALNHRLSAYLYASWQVNDVFSLTQTTYLQPRLGGAVGGFCARGEDNLGNPTCDPRSEVAVIATALDGDESLRKNHLRVSSSWSVIIQASEWLAFKIAFHMAYNSQTPLQNSDVLLEATNDTVQDLRRCPSTLGAHPCVRGLFSGKRAVKPLDTGLETSLVLTF